jgi:hypothetical protein
VTQRARRGSCGNFGIDQVVIVAQRSDALPLVRLSASRLKRAVRIDYIDPARPFLSASAIRAALADSNLLSSRFLISAGKLMHQVEFDLID